MSRFALTLTISAVLATALLVPDAGAATTQDPSSPCLGDVTAAGVPMEPGRPLRMGISPAGLAGTLGPTDPVTPIDRRRTLAALRRLRPPQAPFVLRLTRFSWADGNRGIARMLHETRQYTRRGYRVELQLRYKPRASQEGDIRAWVRFVRKVVRHFAPDPLVTGIQVTNEVNFYPIAPDASDSAYQGARDALIRGVEAAHHLAGRIGARHLRIGFNWVYRTDPATESAFWTYLRDHGGPRFARSVDWVGLDAYPGTVFPPLEPSIGTGYRDGMVNAMSELRHCFMPIAGLDRRVPIHVEENGWPTGPGRPEDEQVMALHQLVGAVEDFRGTYHVTDYRWFDLRDHDTASLNFQHHYGLLRDDYSRKPAFSAYRRLVRQISG